MEQQTDEIMERIGQGIALGQAGDRVAARSVFDELWAEIGTSGDPLHRCALAHSMADVQDDIEAELHWDLRALAASDTITDERAQELGVEGGVSGFFPSLHLNLGEAYRKLGDLDRARDHLELGRAAVDSLEDDGYGRLIRGGLDRLAERIKVA